MSRVFFITRNQLKVFEWTKKKLNNWYEFKNSEEGFREFEDYLVSTPDTVSKILLELLEEEFQRDKIPHVLGSDRKNLIKRQITRHYRDSRHVHARLIGREKNGRRDDEYLLTSISNTEPLDAWVDLLNKHNVPVVGIWSTPLLSVELLKQIPDKTESMLLVSRQMRSTVRESYFNEGKLILSRQVRIERGIRNQRIASTYLSHGADQIHRFLSNQRIIQFSSKLDVFCLMPGDLVEQSTGGLQDTNVLRYHFLSLDEIFDSYGINSDWEREADALFAYLCHTKSALSDHYQPDGDKKYYRNYLINRGIHYLTTLGSLVIATIGAFLLINSLEINEDKQVLDQSTQRISHIYTNTYAMHEEKIQVAAAVKDVVAFSKRLYNEADVSPELFLTPLGNILKQKRFERISLTSLTWNKVNGNELSAIRRDIWRKTTPNLGPYDEYPYNESELDDKVPKIVLTGIMARDGISYRETVSIMEDFVRHLQQLDQVEQLIVNRTPVDIRIHSRFHDQSGVDYTLQAKSDDADIFDIMLLLQPSEPDELDISEADHV